jgi:hypothetical protein
MVWLDNPLALAAGSVARLRLVAVLLALLWAAVLWAMGGG